MNTPTHPLNPIFDTIHFNVGNIGTPAIAPTPGTPDANAMALFGQLNIRRWRRVAVAHLHLVDGGSPGTGTLTVELYRRRDGVLTLIAEMSLTAPGDFSTDGAVPSGDFGELLPGDYLFCQVTSGSLITTGNADGVTVDVHFS